ncbi:N-acyl-aromatic-L-amino acid amidohydrolase (carboxylate-forming) [Phyllostomus hastatus]|uniref:N-acyl-aromatic-L-amino acid amidohydrolase (carboxylate-forming) n=1 Tax=Phyllostomus hastatus TaxID=9423 RepID=UPI001E67F035|nr:N-acyl-aromatic-L-amino acid amidohydrolase (carboxylate-forming) [Phyllostomus hastatus]XP_045710988.1 N-acyl-aromatic-L-amino acid amidohydrolase (carboxylate-forming) [Phyllostomus hastatus]XP_045710989.1 N-acyl-aromatic-L-amino acid amidohydrolase (carboxylate-forming) [Phyllostomus hastatus]
MCSLPVPREPLRRVAVAGGTHGNEMSGVYLARQWLQAPGELQRPSFSTTPVLANPAAAAACRRYVDRDLNRTFTSAVLTARPHPDDPYEVTRARELNQLLGPKASGQAFDFILDLHNTTANVGTCLVLEAAHNVFALHLCRHLQLQSPEPPCRVFLYQLPREESYSVHSAGKNGMGLELGPQPQGVLRADLFTRMRALVAAALDFIQLFNQGTAFPAFEMEVYRKVGSVDFPRTEAGDLAGTVHPQLQDRDFEPLRPGAPIFRLFSGEDALYEGESTVYPVFINEAAYYEKGIAFFQTEKFTVSVPALPALAPSPAP